MVVRWSILVPSRLPVLYSPDRLQQRHPLFLSIYLSLSLLLSFFLSFFRSFFLSLFLSFFLACFLSLSDLWVKESRTGWTMKNQQERPFLSFCEFFLFSSSAARVRVGAALNGECLPLVEHSSLRISRIICKGCGSGIL